jgi:hypothetical protein
MSRTNRHRPFWSIRYRRYEKSPGYDVMGRDRYANGYDRGYSKDLFMPCSKSPRGYNTWDEAASGRRYRRWAKRMVSKLMRQRVRVRPLDVYREEDLMPDTT